MRPKITAAVLGISMLGLSSCGILMAGGGGEDRADAPAPASEAAAVEDGPESEHPERPEIGGDPVELSNGLLVSVTGPESYAPHPDYTPKDDYAESISFEVTLKNTSDSSINPQHGRTSARYGSTEARSFIDVFAMEGVKPNTYLQEGDEVTYSVLFGVDDTDNMAFQYHFWEPGEVSDSAIFVSP